MGTAEERSMAAAAPAPGQARTALTVEDLYKSFGPVEVLKGVSLSANDHDVVSILGSSGSGKSTLLRCINLLETPDSGRVHVKGELIRMREGRPGGLVPENAGQVERIRAKLAMVFQQFNLWSHMTVLQNVIEAPVHVLKVPRAEAVERGEEELRRVGMHDRRDYYPAHLSGGQQQRAAIARALAGRPRLIVLDEAVSSLDMSTQAQVLNLLKDLAGRHPVNYVFISHDIAAVDFMSDRVAVMYLGKIVELENAHSKSKRLTHPYSITLRSAVPVPDPGLERRRTRIVLSGPVASAVDLPSGCRFHTRCPIAQPVCSDSEPELAPHSPTGLVSCHYAGEFDRRYADAEAPA